VILLRKCRIPLLAVAVALLVGIASAQHQPADHNPASSAPAATTTAPQQEGSAAGDHKAEGPGAILAHESREAAGEEEDEAAQFKKAPAVLWLSHLLGISPHAAWTVAIILNFAVLAGLIVFALKKNLPGAFRSRTATIQKGLEEARKASEEANRRLADVEARLAKLDEELGAIRATAEAEAAAEEQRIQAAAEEDKRKIVAGAEAEIAAAAKTARRELKAYAADLAVTLAEKRIHVDQSTDQALVRSFVSQLNNSDANKDGR
jgi:F-type H+-transporting ATPase subunit b